MKKLLPLMTGPSRYMGNEPGTIHKDPESVSARIAFAFPDMYEIGMSYLGQKILYGIVNDHEPFWAERVFAPDKETGELLREHGEPLCTLESDTPLSELDAVSFHITHELCYTNILYMLELGGIPLLSKDRGEDDPLVMAGGGCTFNAEPVAPYLDFMVLGDGEEVCVELMQCIADCRGKGLSRSERLRKLSRIPGVYVPEYFTGGTGGQPLVPVHDDHASIEKRIVTDMDNAPFPTAHVVPFSGSIHDRLTVEIARGCTRGCRFCQAGMIYRPARERSPKAIADIIRDGLAQTGYEELSFLSLSTGDYSALEELFNDSFESCRAEQVAISLPSLRVGSISERIMELMSSIRRTGATLAPEAGSQRLRDVINKGVTEEALLEHILKLFNNGWQQVKLYFMIGLPTETTEDLDAIRDLCLKVRDVAGKHVKRLQVTAAVSPFVPKPHTPFQWERQISIEECREKIEYLKDIFRPHKRLKMRWHEPRMSYLEGIFSRGDRDLAPVVMRAYEKGVLFASWNDHMRLEPWLEAMEEEGLDPQAYLAARDMDAPLPWDHLNSGVTKRFLKTEFKRAVGEKLTDDCRYNACRNCGICNFDGKVSELAAQAENQEISPRVVYEHRDQQDSNSGPEHQTYSAPQTVPEPERVNAQGKPMPPDTGVLSDKACHYRIWHTKLGQLRYVSQVEWQTALERIYRKAGLPVSFSAGFHPQPRVSFGRALSVGVESEREWFNLFLREYLSPSELAERLRPHLPRGMHILEVETLTMGKKQKQAVAEDYIIEFLDDDASDRIAQWQAVMERSNLDIVRVNKKGKEKTVNLRPLILSAEPEGLDAVVIRFDWRERYMSPLRIVQEVNPDLGLDKFILRKKQQWMQLP